MISQLRKTPFIVMAGFILAAAFLTAPAPAPAQSRSNQNPCGLASKPVSVVVRMAEEPLRTNFTLNRQQMNLEGASVLQNTNNLTGGMATSHVGGLANGVIASNMQMAYMNAQDGQGAACSAVDKVEIMLNYQPNIFISREYVQGSCYHQAVMEHEMKHVMTDRQVVREYAPRMKAIMDSTVKNIGVRGPVPVANMATLNEEMKSTLGQALNRIMDAMKSERELRQSQVDTPTEYARVQALCQNWP